MNIPSLTTPRLLLRGFTEQDVKPLYHLLNGPDVLRYFPNPDPPTQERVQKMVSRLLDHWAERGYGLWAVELRETGQFLGRCGLQFISETSETEIDFIFDAAFWGRGLATEAARASLRFGFQELPVESIVGIVHPNNKASQRVLEKNGMQYTERREYFGMPCLRYAIERASYAP